MLTFLVFFSHLNKSAMQTFIYEDRTYLRMPNSKNPRRPQWCSIQYLKRLPLGFYLQNFSYMLGKYI